MQIRLATPEDAREIARVHVETWQLAFPAIMPARVLAGLDVERRATQWAEQLAAGVSEVFVSEIDGRIVGFCELAPTRDADADTTVTAELIVMYIHPDHGRQGIGRALWQTSRESAGRRGCSVVTLWVLRANEPARQFYESLGFEWDGTTGPYRLNDGSEMQKLRYRTEL